jgi:prepilin-type N-terminal cleavage/methylation domain-containing protein
MTVWGLRVIRGRLGAEAGMTLSEMLVVLVILLVVLGGMATLFTSASSSQIDQTNRVEAQRNARLALDSLRREIRCASAVAAVSASSLTITLPGYCQKPATTTAATITWCVPGGSAPYALWRYAGSSCTGTGVIKAQFLKTNTVFSYNRASVLPAPTLTGSATGGTLGPGTYVYDVTAVDAAGKESSGTAASITFATGSTNSVSVSWTPVVGFTYKVYGRDDGSTTVEGLRQLAATSTSPFVDTGTPLTSLTPPLGITAPPLGTVSIALVVDATPGNTTQRFTLADDIVLRNSGRG